MSEYTYNYETLAELKKHAKDRGLKIVNSSCGIRLKDSQGNIRAYIKTVITNGKSSYHFDHVY